MANIQIGRKGFGQVEPNHISGIVEGKIYAQLPTDATMGTIIENGRFAKYDYANGKVDLTGSGEWLMIYNEEKPYDERKQNHKDFAMIATNYVDGIITPRLIATEVGDIITTNCFGANTTGADSPLSAKEFDVEGIEIDETGKVDGAAYQFAVDKTTGYLVLASDANADANGPVWELVKIYTMPDGQPGLKLQRIS